MIDTNKELGWLQEWVNDPADEGTTNLDERKWTTHEVEIIMRIYASELVCIENKKSICNNPLQQPFKPPMLQQTP